jgi:HD-like signal output (HDOD) protein
MNCPACHAVIPDRSNFCNSCGRRIQAAGKPKPAVQPAPVKTGGSEPRSAEANVAAAEKRIAAAHEQAQRVERCLQRILATGDLPALAHHIRELMGFLENDDASLRRLTTLILSDYGLLLMVMRTANSVRYNRSGKRICSVTHAVALLGVNTIRNLASGLHFLEHYRGRSAGLTELILLSTLTAAHAHRIASMRGGVRSEEAALCGMFMNLGEVLIASHLQDRYRMIRHRTKECSWTDRQACIRELGFTYEDLGQAMASYWRLPASVGDAMKSVDDWMHELDPERRLFSAITAFSHELTNAVYRNEQEQNASAAVAALVGWYGETLRLEPDDVRRLLTDGISDTKEMFAALKIQLDDLRLLRQSEAAVATTGNAEDPAEPGARDGANLIEKLENELSAALSSELPIDVNQALMMSLEAIYRGGPFDRVLL